MPNSFVLSLLPFPFSLVFRHRVKKELTSNGSSSTSNELPLGQRSPFERAFYRFGTHAAKHQIRVLLICCVVMSSLAFPALAIHYQTVSNPSSFSSTLRPNSLFNTPLLRPLFDDTGPTRDFPFVRGPDFELVSSGNEEGGVVIREGGGSADKAHGGGRSVRLETIWIGEIAHLIASASPSSPTSGSVLFSSSFNHEAFGAQLLVSIPPSFGLLFCSPPSASSPSPPEQPWAVWTCFLSAEGGDDAHWDEVGWKESISGVLGGLNGSATSWGRVDSAEKSFLVDYSPSTLSSAFTQPSNIASPSPSSRLTSVIPIPVIALYAFLLAWTFRSLASFTPVHNQFGLAFTYVTELAISTTCSGSICVMMGWKLEAIPWFLLPFVISVIGVENMSHVTRAVLSTSISLPVSERLSLGLALSGPTITFTTLSDIGLFALLGALVGDRVAAVRDFCTFTVIVLFADWFLIFAFFATVISIDMQRLELADVLGQRTVPVVPTGGIEMTVRSPASADPSSRRRRRSKPAKSSSRVLRSGFQAVFRRRTTRNGTLLALVSTLFGLWYYYSGSFDLAPHDHRAVLIEASRWTASHGLLGRDPWILGVDDGEEGWGYLLGSSSRTRLWELLNPDHHQEFTLVIPSPTAVVVSTIPHRLKPTDLVPPTPSRSASSLLRLAQPLFWFFKVVVLPISVTTLALYLLLLFLLKDAELLDAQRDRLEIGEEWEDEADARRAEARKKRMGVEEVQGGGTMVAPMMKRVVGLHQADVCLIASSEDGEVIMSVGFDGIALIQKTGDETSIQRLLFPVTSSSDRPLFAAVDATGGFCAVALSKGAVFVWSLDPSSLNPTPITFSSSSSSSNLGTSTVLDISFLPRSTGSPREDLFSTSPSAFSILVAVREDGSLFEYQCVNRVMRVGLPSGDDSVRAICLWKAGRQDVAEISFASLATGRIDFVRRDETGTWTEVASITPVRTLETVSHVTSAVVTVEGNTRELVGIASTSGVVSIWDVSDGNNESIFTLPADSEARITQLRIVDPVLQQCGLCNERFEGFVLLLSTPESLFVHRIAPRQLPSSCNCSAARRTSSESNGRASLDVPPPSSRRSSNAATSPWAPSPVSPLGTPSKRLATSPSTQSTLSADYPMYVHGVHLKRLSNRRSEVEDLEEVLVDEFSGSGSPTRKEPGPSSSSPWSILREELLGTVSIHRGGWEVLDRRRLVGFGKGSTTLLSSVMEGDDDLAFSETHSSSRWQVFQIDLSQPTNGHLLAISVSDLSSLRSTLPPATPTTTTFPSLTFIPTSSPLNPGALSRSSSLSTPDGSSSLRRRRDQRLKQFASQNQEAPPPSVSHALIGPVVAAGRERLLAGTGNSIGAFGFEPLEREGMKSGGAGAGLVLGASPMRRRVEKGK